MGVEGISQRIRGAAVRRAQQVQVRALRTCVSRFRGQAWRELRLNRQIPDLRVPWAVVWVYCGGVRRGLVRCGREAFLERQYLGGAGRSEEHTSELQSRLHLVCRLLLEKKKKNKI